MVTDPVTFAVLVEVAFDEIGRYGASSVSVTRRLLEALANVSACVTREEERRPLFEQATALVHHSRLMKMSPRDRRHIEERYAAVQTAVGVTEARIVDGRYP